VQFAIDQFSLFGRKLNEWYVLQYMKIEAHLNGFDLVDLENIQVPILDKSVYTPDE